jgi:hypothetical protein
MSKKTDHAPKPIHQVMVSSTFVDLIAHRDALITALHKHKLHANVMEHDDAKLLDVIDSSLTMVRDSAAYILVIGMRYGQTPECAKRNPNKLSVTELEFEEAQKLGRPILLFLMSGEHPVKVADFEKDPEKQKKLIAFRDRAKQMGADSKVNRVYASFDSLADFKDKLGGSLKELDALLAKADEANKAKPRPAAKKKAARAKMAVEAVGEPKTKAAAGRRFRRRRRFMRSRTTWGRMRLWGARRSCRT